MTTTTDSEEYFTRNFYTLAADFIRQRGGNQIIPGTWNQAGISSPVLSRGDAARIREAIAKELGMSDEELAKILARAFVRDNP